MLSSAFPRVLRGAERKDLFDIIFSIPTLVRGIFILMSIFSRVARIISRQHENSENAPHFAVFSPISERRDERKILENLFNNGLSTFHLCRPDWSASQQKKWLESLPARLRPCVVPQQFPNDVKTFKLGGFHAKRASAVPSNFGGNVFLQCESFSDVLGVSAFNGVAVLGPIFPPKERDVTVPHRTPAEFAATVAFCKKSHPKTKILAFGGITAENIHLCKKMGFDGIIVSKAVWKASNPVEAFKNLVKKW